MNIVPDIHIRRLMPVGSQVTCDPPPPIEESDLDFLVLVWSMRRAAKQLQAQGWDVEVDRGAYGGLMINGDFFSARMHDHNLIVTSKSWFYHRFANATRLAKNLNLLDKNDRCTLFAYVLHRKHETFTDK